MVRRKTRKIKDKWKEKRWVTVLAPDAFNNVPLGDIPITDDEKAVGRVMEVTLHDILKFGAVSQEIVCQMAEGVLSNSPVHLTSAVTGIAGPNGGSPEKPVGTVYIASACVSQKTLCKMFLFNGDRNKIRLETVEAALSMMLRHVVE